MRSMMQPNTAQKAALAITRGIGSPTSITLHTLLFIGSFAASYVGAIPFDRMLLFLTTIVSLEAIYLSIFIQMTLNYTTESIEEVAEDIDEMQEDVEEIQEDIDEIQEDVDELQEDVEDISEDVEDITEDDKADDARDEAHAKTLSDIRSTLERLMQDVARMQAK